jgi:PEP-CTERM motif
MGAVALSAASANAATVVIDFNSGFASAASYSELGVTFTAIGGGTLSSNDYGNGPNGTKGIVANDGGDFQPINALIAGGANFVSIDLGDFNSDADSLFLRAYDAANNLLGSDAFEIDAAFVGMVTLSVSIAGIDRVEFGGVGGQGSSLYGDNFTYNTGAVPEPATWAMMLLGFGGLGAMLRSRRTVVAA